LLKKSHENKQKSFTANLNFEGKFPQGISLVDILYLNIYYFILE